MVEIEIGTRVRLTHDVDRYPHFIAPKGMTGTVTDVAENLVCVRMDEHVPGAEAWDNEVQWFDGMDVRDDVEVLS